MNKDFIRRVIESAKSELDEKSPVTFTYTPLKDGKKFTRIIFFPVRQERSASGQGPEYPPMSANTFVQSAHKLHG